VFAKTAWTLKPAKGEEPPPRSNIALVIHKQGNKPLPQVVTPDKLPESACPEQYRWYNILIVEHWTHVSESPDSVEKKVIYIGCDVVSLMNESK
jgi:hypothetical protein